MRLGTAIALELCLAAGGAVGVWVGVDAAVARAGDYVATREAAAEPPPPLHAMIPQALPPAELAVAPPIAVPVGPPPNNIFGVHDDLLLAPLRAAPVTKVKINRGGTSLSLRIDFANGARASFKPEQDIVHPQSDPRREIAAYRVDRLLGLGHVSPTKEVAFTVKELLDATEPAFRTYLAGRFTDEAIVRGDTLRGELQWWIPEIKLAAFGSHRIDEAIGRDMWTRFLQVHTPIPVEYRPLLEQLSACILFDVLIDNADRWTGSNTQMSPDGKLLFFMDNTLSFSRFQWGHEANATAMRKIQVFPRGLVKKMRELEKGQIEAVFAMPADSKLAPLLKPFEVRAILSRRDSIVRYIDGLIARYGEDAVLAFP